ncbi:MAG: hypothetical protein IT428_03725 [Planctomycetaceae bacterium]|nr:hypothetical protein [Planctomycetaceae bacterium]
MARRTFSNSRAVWLQIRIETLRSTTNVSDSQRPPTGRSTSPAGSLSANLRIESSIETTLRIGDLTIRRNGRSERASGNLPGSAEDIGTGGGRSDELRLPAPIGKFQGKFDLLSMTANAVFPPVPAPAR